MAVDYDVAIVGAGMGGAALGYRLAQAGHRVLFIEKGLAEFPADERDDPSALDPRTRMRAGRWPDKISGTVDGVKLSFFPALGCGIGGSTLLYAATLERFLPQDFEAVDAFGRLLWPISYEVLEPYYILAEQLFHVRGTHDPLSSDGSPDLLDPPPMSSGDEHFFTSLKRNGMHPYRAHTACHFYAPCDGCGGRICHRSCKLDARTALLEPALQTGNAHVLAQCTVSRIDADGAQVTALRCHWKGEELAVAAKIYVLAAGALCTPLLMLNSQSAAWPEGLANSSGMIGRNLMFHISDFFAVWPRRPMRRTRPGRSIALRDFARHREARLGMVQSTGLSANSDNIAFFLHMLAERSNWKVLKLLKPFLKIPARIGAFVFGKATIFASIMEDRPYPENRVIPDPDDPTRIHFEYTARPELRRRIKLMRLLYRRAFLRHKLIILNPEINLNFGHSCGTCRFGLDATTAVLDENNRCHDLSNLYVVDASFFPTSGGANPSLTIAANALRVADHIISRLAENGLQASIAADLV